MKNIRAICFDLDDTLWDMGPVIPRAEALLYQWFGDHYPQVTAVYTPARIRQLRVAATRRWPELRHDLTELRLRILREIAATAGYDEAMVKGAFNVFIRARNEVTVYPDVIPALQKLAAAHRLFALSNGNADLKQIGLAGHFEAVITARKLGVAKPDSRFFVMAAAICELRPEEILHVGDHPENDIVAAGHAGMHTVWLNRKGEEWPVAAARPAYMVGDMHELAQLLMP